MPNTHQLSISQKTFKTGQTTSHITNDDGTYKRGLKANPRFVDNGDGTISDRASGLMWVKDTTRIAVGTKGRLPQNQVQVFRGYWSNSTSYAVGDLAYDPNTGQYFICFFAHTTVAGPATWGPGGNYYPTGTVVYDSVGGGYWQAVNDNYSIGTPSDWSLGSYYNSGDIVRNPFSPNDYWQAGFSGYSSSLSDWAASTYHNYGDYVRDPFGSNKVYQYQSYGYTITDPGNWSSSTYYSGGEYRYVSSYSGYGISDGYYQNVAGSFYSNDSFDQDYNNGWWSYTGYTDLFQLDRATVGNWSEVYADPFAYNRSVNSWSNVGTDLFMVDRNTNGNWTSVSNTFNFATERATNPTWWEQMDWTSSPYSNGQPATQTLDNSIIKCENLDYAGYTDWRMPNANELFSLLEFGHGAPLVNSLIQGLTSTWYWSSTQNLAAGVDYNEAVYFWTAQIQYLYRYSGYAVLPVRGG